jgi:hypothetical protein
LVGYSGTPLAKKLGLKEGGRVAFVGPPASFAEELGALPAGTQLLGRVSAPVDLIVLFTKELRELRARFPRLAAPLSPDGMLWVAWPKKASGVATDLSFEAVQRVGLDAGLVDTKICAVDEVWSGLRFVIRLKDRPRK